MCTNNQKALEHSLLLAAIMKLGNAAAALDTSFEIKIAVIGNINAGKILLESDGERLRTSLHCICSAFLCDA